MNSACCSDPRDGEREKLVLDLYPSPISVGVSDWLLKTLKSRAQ